MNRNIPFVAIALLLWGFGEGMFFNFIPIYLDRQFLLDESQIGLVLGAFGFSMAVTHIPARGVIPPVSLETGRILSAGGEGDFTGPADGRQKA